MVRSANEKSTSFYVLIFMLLIIGILLIYHDFGVIAFVMFVFVGIFGFGLREKFSNETTASAYSVFNKNGRPIVGGFTASQFENQLRGGGRKINNYDDNPLVGPLAEHRKDGNNNDNNNSAELSDLERTARRQAAAEAAERRFLNDKKES